MFSSIGITSIVIPKSVVKIGFSAFFNCTNLNSITMPDSVSSMKQGAFDDTAWYNNQPDGDVYLGKFYYRYKGTMPQNTSIKIKDGTKNGKTRNITIPNILYQPLWTEYMRKRNKTDFVSTKADGVSMHSRSSWKNMWDSYTKQLGIKFTAHQLRHTYASMLYAAGVDVKSASELLGHSDVEITIKIYTHLAKETKIISIVKYDQFLDDNFVTNN